MKFQMHNRQCRWRASVPLLLVVIGIVAVAIAAHPRSGPAENDPVSALDWTLTQVLRAAGFTGNVEASLEARLAQPTDQSRDALSRPPSVLR